jgi:hypothetical protein
MGWNAISAIAGTLAAIAVALTAVYLAIQIRKNTLATRSQTYYLATAALAEAAAILASNEELARIHRIGLSTPDELTEDDYYRFAMYGISQFRRYENLFFQYRSGLVDDEFWGAQSDNILWFFHRPGTQVWWKDKRLTYSISFREYLESSKETDLASQQDRQL